MSSPISGHAGSGSVVVYTLGVAESFELETLCFQVTTDATAGVRTVEVLLTDQDDRTIARIPDFSDIGPSSTVTYTFGVGLIPSSCQATDGSAAQNDLPVTSLEGECAVTVRSIDATGAVVPGDAISAVTLWVNAGAAVVADAIPLLTPLALSSQAA